MCRCTPSIRTPYCGKYGCVNPVMPAPSPTTINEIDADKTMQSLKIIEQISRFKEELEAWQKENELKEAPFKIRLNGVEIISSEVVQ